MRKIYQSALLLSIFSFFLLTASSQNIEWEKRVGGSPDWASTPGIDQGKSIVALSDGSSVVLINSSSAEGEFTTNSGKRDAWLFKLNAAGGVIWKQRFGGAGDEQGNQVIATTDGGFIISGQTASYPGPDVNAWIIKTDAAGNAIWNKSFGGTQADVANSVCQTTDGYLFTGHTRSNNGNLATAGKPNIHEEDVWYAKLDVNGNHVWSKIFGGFWIDQGYSIIPVADGSGFAIAGFTQSNDREVAGLLKGWRSALVIKINAAGTVLWKQTYGGNEDTRAYSIINIAGGGFAFAGTTNSNSGTISNSKGHYDYLLLKTDALGNLVTSRTYGGSNTDVAFGLAATSDGGHLLIGRSDSPSGGTSDLSTPTYSFDSWILKVDASGTKVWEKLHSVINHYGHDVGAGVAVQTDGGVLITGSIAPGVRHYDWTGTKDENAFVIKYSATGTQVWNSAFGAVRKYTGYDRGVTIKQAPDGAYYILAVTESNDGDLTGLGNKGLRDIILLKYDANRNLVWQKMIGGTNADDAKDMKVTPDGGVIIAANSWSIDGDMPGTIGNTEWADMWIFKVSPAGVIEWKKNYGGHGDDIAQTIELSPGGGYVIGGYTWSGQSGDISVYNGENEAWVLKVDAMGTKVWEKSFGGTGRDEANRIIKTSDGGYALIGSTTSTTLDGVGNHGGYDAMVVKFDANGTKQWSKTYGGTGEDFGFGITQTSDGNLAILGQTTSNSNGDIGPIYTSGRDIFVIKLSMVNGSLLWSKTYGSQWDDEPRDLISTTDGNLLLVNSSYGGTGLFSEGKGNSDVWIVKLNTTDGNVRWKTNYGSAMYDYVTSVSAANNGGYLVTGVRNLEAQWDAMEFSANGEIYAIKVSDNELQSATITTSGPTTFCEGSSVTLTVTSAGAVSYQWYKNGVSIASATNATYNANATGSYSVNAINAGGGIATASVDVLVNPTPTFGGTYNAGDIKQAITFGGYGADQPVTFRQGMVATTDGGYIFTGQTSTNNSGDLTGHPYYGGNDVVVVKLDCGFNVQWKKTFGGSGNDIGYAVIQSADGGYIVVANTSSAVSGDITTAKGNTDGWLIKLDANGNKQWQKSYGGSGGEALNAIVQTPAGDYIAVGWTQSTDGDLTGVAVKGNNDIWMLKINSTGTIISQRRAGGSTSNEEAYYVAKTNDGNYIMCGFSNAIDGDVTSNKGGVDGYVEKFDGNLNKIWTKNFGGNGGEFFIDVKPSVDGGYIIAGYGSSSANGDFSGVTNGPNDLWLIKISSTGTLIWDRNYGGPFSEQGHSVETTADGGYIVSGITQANGGDVTGFKGVADSWLIRLDPSGNLLWQKTYGGSLSDFGNVVVKNNSGEIVVLGRSPSVDGDLAGLTNNGGNDYWLTRIADCSSQFTGAAITPASSGVIFETQYQLTANAGTGYTYQWYRNNKAIAGAVNQTYNAVATGIYKVSITNGACPGYSNEIPLIFNNKFYVNDAATANDVYTTAIGSDANNGSSASPFATIGNAVTKVKAGDTIYVDAGTYAEQVTLDKGLTIIGAGDNLSFITAPATLVAPPGSFPEKGLIQTIQNIGDVHISKLSVTGDYTKNLTPIIIQSGGTVRNCSVQNGNQGIFFRVESTTKTAIVENNNISAEYIAVNFAGTGLTASLLSNAINVVNTGFSAGVFAGLDFGPLPKLTITNNSFNNFATYALNANSLNSVYAQNSFTGRPVAKFIEQSVSTPSVATCNWFGTTNAETIASKMTGAINYAPWLTSGVDTSAAIGFQAQLNVCNGRQNKFYVNNNDQTGDVFTTAIGNNANNGFSTAPFATINHAMSIAQAGDTIIIDAGVYAEFITVNKSLTLRGAKTGNCPGASLSRGYETIITPPTTNFLTTAGNLITITAVDVKLDGLTLDGDNPMLTSGYNMNGADVDGFSAITNNTATAANMQVVNCIIKNFNRNGIGMSNNVSGINISCNRIDNLARLVGTQGIQADARAINMFGNNYGTITNNYITRVSTGIIISSATAATSSLPVVTNNTISSYTIGLNFQLFTGPATPYEVTGNILSTSDYFSWVVTNQTNPAANSNIGIRYLDFNINSALAIERNDINGTSTGIAFHRVTAAGGINIKNHNISLAERGMIYDNIPSPITITNNAISNYTLGGITINSPGTVITSNSMVGVGNAFAIQNSGAEVIQATCNWYGVTDANSVDSKIIGPVEYSPWLTSGTDTDAAIGFQPVSGGCNGVGLDADVITVNNVTCNGAANGSIDILMEEGLAPFTYAWSKDNVAGFAITEDLTDLGPGVYHLKVTDANGSVDETTTVTITEPAVFGVSSSSTNITCSGAGNGSATVTATGGTLPYTYLWSNEATTNAINNLGAGTYSVIVTDANGCTANAEIIITEPEELLVSNDGLDVSCNGADDGFISLSVSGGTGEYTFLWSNGATGSALYDLGAGTYSVTVTDANGCSIEGSYTINEPAILEATATGTNVTSAGASDGTVTLTLTGGTEPYDILWSNGETTTQLSGLPVGIYTADIMDMNGCMATASYEVQGPSITISVSGTNVNCFNGSDGTATATPLTGTAPFTYAWSNGETTETISGLTPGTYSVTVTDADNSSATGEFTVSAPLTAVTAFLSASPVLCFGGNTGSATATGNGGTGAYTYLWSNGSTIGTVNNLTAGIYSVTVTDANGCAVSENIEVTQPTQLVASASGTNATCNGGNNGSATVSVTGGTEPYTYLWSNGITTYNNTGLPVGTYTVTVTDGNGCTANASYTVTQPSPVNASITSNNITCFGANNGSISIDARGGTAPYLYSFNNGAYGSTVSWTGLVPGAYTVVAKDANNCLFTSTITITQPQVLAVMTDATTNTCVGSNNGTIAITVSGGTTKYAFSWTGPNGFTAVKEDLTGLAAGDYTVTITDANGCVVTKIITIAELAAPSVTETITPVTCFGTSTGGIALAVSAGTFTYSWAGPGGYKATTKDIANLKAGTYTVTITPAGGCIKTAAYTVTQPIVLAATTVKTDITVCGGTGSITVTATGGNPSYLYSKGGNVFQAGNSFTGLTAGSYTITVRDSKGCTVTAAVTIVDNGADPYEANERQTNAKDITVNAAVITARIAPTANDKDWYRFTTASAGTYTLAVTHPTVLYSYDIYDSRGRVITPASTSGSSKNYSLLANTVYAVQVRGALSYVCYQMQVTSLLITSTARIAGTGDEVTYSEKAVATEELKVEKLNATVYPNPHSGMFNLLIKSPENGRANIELFSSNGQKVIVRNVAVKAGDNIVTFNNIQQSLLLYKVTIGNNYVSGKVIGPK